MSSWGIKGISMQQANFLTHMIFAFIEMRADGSLVVGSANPLNPEATASKSEARLQQLMAVKAKTSFPAQDALRRWRLGEFAALFGDGCVRPKAE